MTLPIKDYRTSTKTSNKLLDLQLCESRRMSLFQMGQYLEEIEDQLAVAVIGLREDSHFLRANRVEVSYTISVSRKVAVVLSAISRLELWQTMQWASMVWELALVIKIP